MDTKTTDLGLPRKKLQESSSTMSDNNSIREKICFPQETHLLRRDAQTFVSAHYIIGRSQEQ